MTFAKGVSVRPEVEVQVQPAVQKADVAQPQLEAPRHEDPLTVQELVDPLADPLVESAGMPSGSGAAAPGAPAAPGGNPLQMLTEVTGTITGHASPRWESPGAGETAEGNNQALSEGRAAAVRREFIRLFDERMRDQVDYQLAARCSEGGDGEGGDACPIEEHGAGDAVTTEEAGGEPAANERELRRVSVDVRVRHDRSREECEETFDVQEEGADQRSGEASRCSPNHTTDWSMRLGLSAGVHIVGGAAALVVHLRNNRTGQQSQALIGGLGIGGGIGGGGSGDVSESDSDWVSFTASRDGEPITFTDFNGRAAIFGSVGAAVVGGAGFTTLRIPALVSGPINFAGFQLGLGASVNVNMGAFAQATGPSLDCEPAEYEIVEGEECRSVHDTVERSYSARISFATESADVDEQALQMLTEFVDRVAADVRGGGDSAPESVPCDTDGTDFHCGG
jgi:hypothetical protein